MRNETAFKNFYEAARLTEEMDIEIALSRQRSADAWMKIMIMNML